MKTNYYFLIILIFLSLTSCEAGKKFTRSKGTAEKSMKEFLSSTELNTVNYRDLRIKYTGKIQSESTKLNVSGQIRIIHDSLIWMNATALLGIEAGRLLITKDTVYVQDNFKSLIKMYSVQQFADSFGITADLMVLEKLLLGEFARMEVETYTRIEDLEIASSYFAYLAQYVGKSNNLSYKAFVRPDNFRVDSLELSRSFSSKNVKLKYGVYLMVDSVTVPSEINFILADSISATNALVMYKKLYFDKETSNPGLSENFTRIRM